MIELPSPKSALKWAAPALLMVLLVPPAMATHDEGCVPEGTANAITLGFGGIGSGTYYLEPRPLILALGILVSEWWLYEETNGVPWLQRGGIGLLGSSFPPSPLPGVISNEDPINDENCGHGRDRVIGAVAFVPNIRSLFCLVQTC